jgi:di/tricarboxylate transporter
MSGFFPYSLEQAIVVLMLVWIFVAFLREWTGPDLVAMTAFTVLIILGIVDSDRARSVFGNPAPIIVACMFVLSAALERTGVIESLGRWFSSISGTGPTRILVTLMLLVALLSGLVNNTPVVVVFLPIVLGLCRRLDLKASRFLIPLSYAAIVGGTCTIIGTSTNLLASGIAEGIGREQGIAELRTFGMFEITKLGIVFVAVTMVYMLTFGRKLLPDRVTLATLFEAEEGKEFLTQAVVSKGSPLEGKAFPATRLARLRGLRVIEIIRGAERLKTALNETVFEAGDSIVFKTQAGGVIDLAEEDGICMGAEDALGLREVKTESAILMEGIIGPTSTLIGHSLKELNFRQRFGVIILAVHRRGQNLREHFQDVDLAFGDTLLVEGPVEQMNKLFQERDFINLSRPREDKLRRTKAPLAVIALIGFMVLGASTDLPLVGLALGAALLTLLTRCIDPAEAYGAIEWKVIFMIFGMLGVGEALASTGIASGVSAAVVDSIGRFGPHVVLAGIYFLAAVLTELISNNAVAALLTPIAITVAIDLGVDPRPFVVAVMFGSSASFATPIGYQTNTYVFGAGGYKFSDFPRVGLPLTLILWCVASLLIPVFWPL